MALALVSWSERACETTMRGHLASLSPRKDAACEAAFLHAYCAKSEPRQAPYVSAG